MRKTTLVTFLLLTACVSSSQVRPLRPNEIAIGPYHERGAQSFVGSLMYEGRCLLFDGESGAPRLLPIWPTGSRFEESLVTFHHPAHSDQRVLVGEEIRLDGQAAHWSELDQRTFAPFQRQCGWAKPFFVSSFAPAN